MEKTAKSRAPRPQRGATRDLILDAAEKVFSRGGLHGTAVRDIFSEAGISSGLLTYYFESKQDLFADAVLRRLPEMKARFHAGMEAIASSATPSSPEEIVEAYNRFFLEIAVNADDPLHDYIILVAHCASSYDDELINRLLGNFDFINETIMAELARALPYAPAEAISEGMFYLESAMATMLLGERFRRVRLGDDNRATIEKTASHMARFFAGGIVFSSSISPGRRETQAMELHSCSTTARP